MPSSPIATQLVFDGFLESLKLQGFSISTGHYLRLHKLLARIGPNCTPHDVKTILCPIFAANEGEQQRFYEQYDAYFNYESGIQSGAEALDPLPAKPASEVDKHQSSRKKRLAQILGLSFSGLVVAIILLIMLAAGPDHPFPANNIPTPTPTPTASVSTPTPPPFTFLFFRNLGVEPSTLLRILLALLPLIVFAIYEIYRRIRRRRRQDDDDRDQPGIPTTFGASLGDVYDADDLIRVARLLRARQRSGELQLDIVESVIATVRALGFFTLREKAVSKPPEYLVLIDRAAFRDHQARLFYELVHKLNAEGVFVTCYYFEGDPRVSFIWPFESTSAAPVVRSAEAQQKLEEEARRAQRGVTLEELHDLYTDHRLLIFGEGTDLVDPLTLQTVDWIKSFTHWQDRAVLTPRQPSHWDSHELALSQQFVVMPATLRGVELTIESFAIREPVSIPGSLRGDSSLPPHDIDSAEDLPELRGFLGERVFQWLCACAVHPQLQWDLTLVLAEQLSQRGGGVTKGKPDESLFTEENLLRLFGLSWFRVGTIPDSVRERLMRQLSARNEATVRQTIAELRKKAAASEISLESFGAVRVPLPQEFAGQVPVQLFQRFRNLRDGAFKRFLQPPPLVLILKNILPSWLQRLLFTPLGLRAGVRVALVVLVSLVVWVSYPTLASAFQPVFGSTNVNANTNVNINTNVNANANASVTPIPVNTNANANANLSPSPTVSPLQSPSLSPSPTMVPASPSPTASVSFSLTPTPSTPTPTGTPTPTSTPTPAPSTPTPTSTPTPATPTPTPLPTRPPPSPTPSLPPNVGILMFEVRPSTIAAGQSTQVLFDIRQAMRIRITPADDELTDWNRRFAAAERIQDFKQSARVRPQQTTTYTITADVVTNPRAQSFTTVSQSVTVTVIDTSNAGQRCSPGRFNYKAIDVPGGSIKIAITKKCSDNVEQWNMTLDYDPVKASPSTASYEANGPDEEEAMRGLSRSRSLPSSFVNAIQREVYPVLSSDDPTRTRRKFADAIARALQSVK